MKRIGYYIEKLRMEVSYLPKNLCYFFTKKKRAIYVGCTGHGNLGDEAILKAITMMLGKDFYLYEISYAKPSSGKYLRKLIIRNPDFIIIGGGTIIRKGTNESYLKIINDSIKLWPNAKIAVLGPGVAEPYFANFIGFPIDVEGWKDLLNKAVYISVRGLRSKNLLNSWFLNGNVNILHDPAIWFTRNDFERKGKQKRIGLNFADIGNRIYGKNQDLIKQFALELVSALKANGWSIFLYPTTKSDMAFMLEDIGLKDIEGMTKHYNYTNLEKSLDFLESLDIFIGQRLHSIIFSATVSTPFFALEYEPKTKDFLETINMATYSQQVDRLNVMEIFNKIEEMYLNIDYEQSCLNANMVKAKKEQEQCLNLFLSNL
ncbi:polysaccharide pyruvyl transferase family protein [Gelidibacter japonicus]|uniref:polysaccharide pyruvyl transferase family protein n=1 Tax=Gelidibacter japonicus TaxID=1962232 RepID=UPI003A8F4FB7